MWKWGGLGLLARLSCSIMCRSSGTASPSCTAAGLHRGSGTQNQYENLMETPLASCTLPAAPAKKMVHWGHWVAASQAHGCYWFPSLHPSCPSCLVLLRPAQLCNQSWTSGRAVPAWPLCVSLGVTHALCPPKSWRGDIPERVVCAGASQGTALPEKVLRSQRGCKQSRAGPLPGTQLGGNRGGPASPRS